MGVHLKHATDGQGDWNGEHDYGDIIEERGACGGDGAEQAEREKAVAANELRRPDCRPVECPCPREYVCQGHHPRQQQHDFKIHMRKSFMLRHHAQEDH